MTTAAERLKQLSGLAGVTAATMLLAIGSGATAGQALANYSGLASGTAAEHLLVQKLVVQPDQTGCFWSDGFWTAGFWADGVWKCDVAVPLAPRGPTAYVRVGFSDLAYRQYVEAYRIGYKEDTVFKAMPAHLGSVPRELAATMQVSGDYRQVRIQYSPDETVADSPTSAEIIQQLEQTDRSRHGKG